MPDPHGDRGNFALNTCALWEREPTWENQLQGFHIKEWAIVARRGFSLPIFMTRIEIIKHTSHYVGTSRLTLVHIFRRVPDMQFDGLVGLVVSCRGSDMFLLFTLQMKHQHVHGRLACKLELRHQFSLLSKRKIWWTLKTNWLQMVRLPSGRRYL